MSMWLKGLSFIETRPSQQRFHPRGRLAQLVRAPALQAGCRGFKSLTAHQIHSTTSRNHSPASVMVEGAGRLCGRAWSCSSGRRRMDGRTRICRGHTSQPNSPDETDAGGERTQVCGTSYTTGSAPCAAHGVVDGHVSRGLIAGHMPFGGGDKDLVGSAFDG